MEKAWGTVLKSRRSQVQRGRLVRQKERRGGGLCGETPGEVWDGGSSAWAEEKNKWKKENMKLSQQVMSLTPLQNKAPLPTLLIPVKVCEGTISCVYPWKKILQNEVSDSRYSLRAAIEGVELKWALISLWPFNRPQTSCEDLGRVCGRQSVYGGL